MQSVKGPESATTVVDENVAYEQTSNGQDRNDRDLFDAVWRFFCSTRLALVLILIIAAAGLAGTLLQQAPPGVTADPVEYTRWLARVRPRYGVWTDVLSTLQLLDVFNALWFRLLLAGLVISTVVCTLNRWNGIWRSISRPRIRMGAAYFRRASHSVTLPARGMDSGAAAEATSRTLADLRYRVLSDRDGDAVYLYADKNRFGKLGTFLNHLSLVLILVGAILGGMLGFRDREFMIAVGSERAVGFGTGLTLRVDQFIDEYYPEGPPKDFRTDAVLFENGTEVGRHTIRVNDPLEYKGVRFYQSFFGPAAAIKVKDAAGNELFNDGVPLAYRTKEERPLGSFTVPSKSIDVWVLGPFSGRADPLVPAGQMRLEVYQTGSRVPILTESLVMSKPKQIGDLEFTFVREMQFTGLQVAKDPGTPIIWLASTLMVIGLAMVFYFPHRRIWVVCQSGERRTEVVLGATARRDMGFDAEFRRVVAAVEHAVTVARRPVSVPAT